MKEPARDSKEIEIKNLKKKLQINVTKNPVEEFIKQNEESQSLTKGDAEEKKLTVDHHHHDIPSYKPPPLPHYHPHPHPRYPHHVDLTVIYLSLFLVLGAILGVCLHGLSYTANNTTLLSNTSFAPNIHVNVNSTSDSDSSADTTSNISVNTTYPLFIYENGTLTNITFIPIVGGGFGIGGGIGIPIWGRNNIGSVSGNFGRQLYENFDDIVEQFTNSFQTVDYEK